jgi:RHS repeat-associated protein
VAASTHASNAPFTIKYSGGSKTIAVNQRSNNGQWMLLGSFSFVTGTPGSITLTDNANGTVIADAVKLTATTGGTTSETIRYLHSDHLNTPRLATNNQAQVVWRWEGSAFGDTAPTGTVTINLRFAGQYYDSETGLFYNWNRYYDPKTGRYISSDPIGLEAGLNTYAYVYDNPLRWTDRLGLMGRAPGGGVPDGPPAPPAPSPPGGGGLACDGTWRYQGWNPSLPRILRRCICYWLCVPCDGAVAWGGIKESLPSTTGQIYYQSGKPPDQGDIEEGNSCACAKPGPEKDCKPCPPKTK